MAMSPDEFERRFLHQRVMQSPTERAEAGERPAPPPMDDTPSQLWELVGDEAMSMIAPGLLGGLAHGAVALSPMRGNPVVHGLAQSAAGYGGRKINQALGLKGEGEGLAGDIASGAIPLAGELGGSLVRRGVQRLMPGATKQEALEQVMGKASTRINEMPGMFIQAPSREVVNEMFEQATHRGVKLDSAPLKAMATEIRGELEDFARLGTKSLEDKQLTTLVDEVINSPGVVDLRSWQTLNARIRDAGRTSQRAGDASKARDFHRLADAGEEMLDHMPKAGTSEAIGMFQSARAGWHAMRSSEELSSVLQKGVKFERDGTVEVVNIGAIKQQLLHPKSAEARRAVGYLKKSGQFDTMLGELSELGQDIKSVRMTPEVIQSLKMDPTTAKLFGGAIGGGTGFMLGGGYGAAAGAGLGGVAGPVLFDGLARMLTSRQGRWMLGHVLSATGGELSHSALSMLGQGLSAGGRTFATPQGY